MRSPLRSRLARRAPRALAATLALLVAVGVQQHATAPADAQAAPPFRVEVSTTTGLLDGEQIEVRVIAQGTQTINGGQVKICRADATYTTISDSYPFTGKCPGSAISSSASPNNVVNVHPLPDRRTAVGTMRIGTGRVAWGPTEDTDRFDLTCDATNPCRLVVFLRDGGGRDVIDPSTQLTFTDADPLAGCGGTADGALSTGGPDRFIDSWAHLTRLHCQATGEPAASTAVLTGEGAGLTSFHSGSLDLTYSAVGPVLGERQPATRRGSTSVPIGLNAVVVGMLGGYPSSDADWPAVLPRPYRDVRLTPTELATLFGSSAFAFDANAGPAVQARNPELADVLRHSDRGIPVAPGNADATVWLATRWFDTVAGDAWRSPVNQSVQPNTPRGVHDELSASRPPFEASFLELYTQRAGLKKAAADPAFALAGSFGAQFVLTDLATATQLGIPTVAIQNRRGEYVAPTAASLAASVPTMAVGDDGTVTPVASPDAAGAYPLAYVEHAVAPTEPLVTADCAPRPDSQALLTGWLEHLVGDGQEDFDGLVPLPPTLVEVAEESIDRIGTADATGTCGPKVEPPVEPPAVTPPGSVPGGVPGGIPGGIPGLGSGFPGGPTAGLGGTGPGGVDDGLRESTPEDVEDVLDDAGDDTSLPDLPGLLGISALGGSTGLTGLLALAVMGAAVGSLTAGPRRRRGGAAGSPAGDGRTGGEA